VLIDGISSAVPAISVFDDALLRGDGCFEALRSYDGRPFRVADHLDRMTRSASALDLPLPDKRDLERWIAQVAKEGGDGIVRVVLTRGGPTTASHTIVLWESLPDYPRLLRLKEVVAPWHPGGFPWDLAGVKWLSYAPNMAASRAAKRAGFDDALLISREGSILEGPTFSIAWVIDGVLETPELALGILASVTRRVALSVAESGGIQVREGRFPLERLEAATEVVALSTTKEIYPVGMVGDRLFEAGPVSRRLATMFSRRVEEELG